jgi:RNA polymerase-binding transcription factor DksA
LPDFDTQQIEKRLKERAREIAARREGLRRDAENMLDGELADYDQHPGDQGTETHEQQLDETTDMMLEAEAENVQTALERLSTGDYGSCVDCGKGIPPARLEAIPEAVRCIEDQARYDATLRARWTPPNPAI